LAQVIGIFAAQTRLREQKRAVAVFFVTKILKHVKTLNQQKKT
jgi:hypothetical protein